MKRINPKHIIFIIVTILIILLITVVSIIISKKENKTSSEPTLAQEVSINTSSVNNTSNPIIAIIEDDESEEEKIYGYDENAMQVESSYNGFPVCGYIEIPKTGVSLPVLSNQTVSGMEYSCCMLYSTGTINLSGNTYIVGHNYDNGTLFSNNKFLSIGDKIILTGLYKNRLEYTIYSMFTTTPEDTSYLTRPIDEKNIELTLQTCNNDAEDTRLIIQAVHEIKK